MRVIREPPFDVPLRSPLLCSRIYAREGPDETRYVTRRDGIAAVTDRVVRMSHGRVVEDDPASFQLRLPAAV